MQGLTKKQREIIDFIESYIAKKRYSPSYREIQDFFNFSSIGSVYNHIQALKKKGALSENSKQARSLLPLTNQQTYQAPLIGKLKGGYPIETFSQMIQIPFPSLPKEECYLLAIEGEALLEECLQPNDLILVTPRTQFENGEMVIALVDSQTTVVKRAYFKMPHIRFESITPQVHPLILREDHVQIQGIILTVFRNLS